MAQIGYQAVSNVLEAYRLRMRRKRKILRAIRKRRELSAVADRTREIRPGDILCFTTLRNERVRLSYFLRYYRDLGVDHFLMIDNASDDGSREFLAEQPDVSLWTTPHSYKRSNFGTDWINGLLRRHAHGHWALVVDVDEFLVYPEIACWFDSGNYVMEKNPLYRNLWIQGGPRMREFFADNPERAPALNKIPLVKWQRSYAFVNSTHMLLPRGLNLVYDEWGGEKTSGCLLHAKFLDTFREKAREELKRRQHYANSHEYRAYHERLSKDSDLWCQWSEKYINWRQLEILGLMSKGNWA